jgi:hypothetical protein
MTLVSSPIDTPNLFDLVADVSRSQVEGLELEASVVFDGQDGNLLPMSATEDGGQPGPSLSVCEDGGADQAFSFCEDGDTREGFSFCEDGDTREGFSFCEDGGPNPTFSFCEDGEPPVHPAS